MSEITLSIDNICDEYLTNITISRHIHRKLNKHYALVSSNDYISNTDKIIKMNTEIINDFIKQFPMNEYYIKYEIYYKNIKYLYPISISVLRNIISKSNQSYSDNSIKEWFIPRAVKLDMKTVYHIYYNDLMSRLYDEYPNMYYRTAQKIVGYMWNKFKKMEEYHLNNFPLELSKMLKPYKVKDMYDSFLREKIEELKKMDEWMNVDDKSLWKEVGRQWRNQDLNPNNKIAINIMKQRYLSNNEEAIAKL